MLFLDKFLSITDIHAFRQTALLDAAATEVVDLTAILIFSLGRRDAGINRTVVREQVEYFGILTDDVAVESIYMFIGQRAGEGSHTSIEQKHVGAGRNAVEGGIESVVAYDLMERLGSRNLNVVENGVDDSLFLAEEQIGIASLKCGCAADGQLFAIDTRDLVSFWILEQGQAVQCKRQ